jgi:hypothetical protein
MSSPHDGSRLRSAVEDRNLEEAVTRLRDAVGLEERH